MTIWTSYHGRSGMPSRSGYRVDHATSGAEGIERVGLEPPTPSSSTSGSPTPPASRRSAGPGIDARIPVVFITVARLADDAIEIMKQGAYDYLLKPLDSRAWRRSWTRPRIARLSRVPARVVEIPVDDDLAGDSILGTCLAMQEVYKAIGRVVQFDLPVLIRGESGTGKELVARAIHQHGSGPAALPRAHCVAVPETCSRGAVRPREGRLHRSRPPACGEVRAVQWGTLFLDEVGDMPLATQAKMLRVLQDQEFVRVGGGETIRTNVRLIAATHRDLKRWSAEGRFRPDLYHRIGAVPDRPAATPRARGGPRAPRASLLARFGREFGRHIVEIAPEAMERLRRHSWPGNIRELQNVLRQCLLRSRARSCSPTSSPNSSRMPRGREASRPRAQRGDELEAFVRRKLSAGEGGVYEETHRWVDRLLLTHGDSRTREAIRGGRHEILGIARKTLRTGCATRTLRSIAPSSPAEVARPEPLAPIARPTGDRFFPHRTNVSSGLALLDPGRRIPNPVSSPQRLRLMLRLASPGSERHAACVSRSSRCRRPSADLPRNVSRDGEKGGHWLRWPVTRISPGQQNSLTP